MSDVHSDTSDIGDLSDFDDNPQSVMIDFSNGSPLSSNELKIFHYNIDSILANNKLDQLTDVCRILSVDCLVITESHLDATIPSNLLSIPGMHEPIRHDRPQNGRFGGGCLVYVSQKLTFQHKLDNQLNVFEHLWVDIKVNNKIYSINSLYRPPNNLNQDDFLKASETLLQRLNSHTADTRLIISDLNFGNCFSKRPILQHKSLDSFAPELFQSYGFTQVIDIPTRITQETMSLVDLIFVDNLDSIT